MMASLQTSVGRSTQRSMLPSVQGSGITAGIELELGTKGLGGENLERYLELAAEMQASVLRAVPEIDLQPGDVRAVNCAVQRTAAELKKIVSDLERAEITLCIENYEGWPVAALAGVVEMLDSPHIRICLDTVNSLGRGEDLEKVVTTLAPLVGNLHIKDFVTRRVPHRLGFVIEGAPAGAGLLPVREILGKMLPTISVILEQWTPLGDSIAETVACEHGWAKEGMSVLRVMLEG